jgi:hypothetical protein
VAPNDSSFSVWKLIDVTLPGSLNFDMPPGFLENLHTPGRENNIKIFIKEIVCDLYLINLAPKMTSGTSFVCG